LAGARGRKEEEKKRCKSYLETASYRRGLNSGKGVVPKKRRIKTSVVVQERRIRQAAQYQSKCTRKASERRAECILQKGWPKRGYGGRVTL